MSAHCATGVVVAPTPAEDRVCSDSAATVTSGSNSASCVSLSADPAGSRPSRGAVAVLPGNWLEFRTNNYVIEDIRRIRQCLLRDSSSEDASWDERRRPQYKHRQLRNFSAVGVTSLCVYFHRDAVKRTQTKPSLSYCSNPSSISLFKSRSQILSAATEEVREMLQACFSGKPSGGVCSGDDDAPLLTRHWYDVSPFNTNVPSLHRSVVNTSEHHLNSSCLPTSADGAMNNDKLPQSEGRRSVIVIKDANSSTTIGNDEEYSSVKATTCAVTVNANEPGHARVLCNGLSIKPNRSLCANSDIPTEPDSEKITSLADARPVHCNVAHSSPDDFTNDQHNEISVSVDNRVCSAENENPKLTEEGDVLFDSVENELKTGNMDDSSSLYDPFSPTAVCSSPTDQPEIPGAECDSPTKRSDSPKSSESLPSKSVNIAFKAFRSKLKPVPNVFMSQDDLSSNRKIKLEKRDFSNADLVSRIKNTVCSGSVSISASLVGAHVNQNAERSKDTSHIIVDSVQNSESPEAELDQNIDDVVSSKVISDNRSDDETKNCYQQKRVLVSEVEIPSIDQPSVKCELPVLRTETSSLKKRRRFTDGPLIESEPKLTAETKIHLAAGASDSSGTETVSAVKTHLRAPKSFIISEKQLTTTNKCVGASEGSVESHKSKWDVTERGVSLQRRSETQSAAADVSAELAGTAALSHCVVDTTVGTTALARSLETGGAGVVESNKVCCTQSPVKCDTNISTTTLACLSDFRPVEHSVTTDRNKDDTDCFGSGTVKLTNVQHQMGPRSYFSDSESCSPSSRHTGSPINQGEENFPSDCVSDVCTMVNTSDCLKRESPESRTTASIDPADQSVCVGKVPHECVPECLETVSSSLKESRASIREEDASNSVDHIEANRDADSTEIVLNQQPENGSLINPNEQPLLEQFPNKIALSSTNVDGTTISNDSTNLSEDARSNIAGFRDESQCESKICHNEKIADAVELILCSKTEVSCRQHGTESENLTKNILEPEISVRACTNEKNNEERDISMPKERLNPVNTDFASTVPSVTTCDRVEQLRSHVHESFDVGSDSRKRGSRSRTRSSSREHQSHQRERRSSSHHHRSRSLELSSRKPQRRSRSRGRRSRSCEERSRSRDRRSCKREHRSRSRDRRSRSREHRSRSRHDRSRSREHRSRSRSRRSRSRGRRSRSRGRSSRSKGRRSRSKDRSSRSKGRRSRSKDRRSRSKDRRSRSKDRRSRSKDRRSRSRDRISRSRGRRSHSRDRSSYRRSHGSSHSNRRSRRSKSRDRRSQSHQKQSAKRVRSSGSRDTSSRTCENRSDSLDQSLRVQHDSSDTNSSKLPRRASMNDTVKSREHSRRSRNHGHQHRSSSPERHHKTRRGSQTDEIKNSWKESESPGQGSVSSQKRSPLYICKSTSPISSQCEIHRDVLCDCNKSRVKRQDDPTRSFTQSFPSSYPSLISSECGMAPKTSTINSPLITHADSTISDSELQDPCSRKPVSEYEHETVKLPVSPLVISPVSTASVYNPPLISRPPPLISFAPAAYTMGSFGYPPAPCNHPANFPIFSLQYPPGIPMMAEPPVLHQPPPMFQPHIPALHQVCSLPPPPIAANMALPGAAMPPAFMTSLPAPTAGACDMAAQYYHAPAAGSTDCVLPPEPSGAATPASAAPAARPAELDCAARKAELFFPCFQPARRAHRRRKSADRRPIEADAEADEQRSPISMERQLSDKTDVLSDEDLEFDQLTPGDDHVTQCQQLAAGHSPEDQLVRQLKLDTQPDAAKVPPATTAIRSILLLEGFEFGRVEKRVSFLDGYRPGEGSSSDEADQDSAATEECDALKLEEQCQSILSVPDSDCSEKSEKSRKDRLKLKLRVIRPVCSNDDALHTVSVVRESGTEHQEPPPAAAAAAAAAAAPPAPTAPPPPPSGDPPPSPYYYLGPAGLLLTFMRPVKFDESRPTSRHSDRSSVTV